MRSIARKQFVPILLLVLAVAVAGAGTGTGWAQQAASSPPASAAHASGEGDSQGLHVMAAVAGGIGSLFYIPFKALAICPSMALAAGVSLALARGETTTADYLLRVGCTGTYLITPQMVRGQEEFQGTGGR